MNFVININLDNAAFDSIGGAETRRSANAVATCLRRMAETLRESYDDVQFGDTRPIMDSDGNKVGAWEVRGQTVEQRHRKVGA